MKRAALLTTILAFLPLGLAQAAGEPPPAPPTPAPEMVQLRIFEGTAQCTGTQHATQFGAEHPTRSVVHGRTMLGGFLVMLAYDERKTKQNPNPVHAIYLLGYDASAKHYTSTGFDGFGGRGNETASAWDGDKLSFTGDVVVAGQKLAFRDTFTKVGERQINHVAEFQGSDGKWTTLDEEICKG
jgi:hypothetical protein